MMPPASDPADSHRSDKAALREAVARRRIRSSIAREVEWLALNEADRAEMRAVREQMAELAPESLD